MRKFPSIYQFRHVVESVTAKATYVGNAEDGTPLFDNTRPKPVLTFNGTVKLHGSNGAIAIHFDTNTIVAQSRERELTLADDNHGFCAWTQGPSGQAISKAFAEAAKSMWTGNPMASLHVYGEWCGPSVNSKTGIGKLPERFVVFNVLVTDTEGNEYWLKVPEFSRAVLATIGERTADLNFITEFKQWSITIDFNEPEKALDILERLTLEVEASCPAAAALGGEGIGEGIVWVCEDPTFGRFTFKVKGAKHVGTKSKRLLSIAPETVDNLETFIEAVLTESRLEQGLDYVKSLHKELTPAQMGEFLKWIGTDVLREEADTLEASGLKRTEVMGPLNRRAKTWWAGQLAAV